MGTIGAQILNLILFSVQTDLKDLIVKKNCGIKLTIPFFLGHTVAAEPSEFLHETIV